MFLVNHDTLDFQSDDDLSSHLVITVIYRLYCPALVRVLRCRGNSVFQWRLWFPQHDRSPPSLPQECHRCQCLRLDLLEWCLLHPDRWDPPSTGPRLPLACRRPHRWACPPGARLALPWVRLQLGYLHFTHVFPLYTFWLMKDCRLWPCWSWVLAGAEAMQCGVLLPVLSRPQVLRCPRG